MGFFWEKTNRAREWLGLEVELGLFFHLVQNGIYIIAISLLLLLKENSKQEITNMFDEKADIREMF